MKFVLRDDDTCAFTTPENITGCYRDVWGEVPVSLSVTPFRVPGAYDFVPQPYYGKTDPVALDTNAELVAFLREAIGKQSIDISLHGYHHDVYDGVPEYVAGQDLLRKTVQARQYLSELLGRNVVTFVPPHNSIGKNGLRAVVGAGLNLVNIPSLWSWQVRDPSLNVYMAMPRYYWHRKVRSRAYPHVLDFKDHKEVFYHTAGPQSDRKHLFAELDYCDSQDGVFVLSTHYHAFDREIGSGGTVRSLVFDLLNRAKSRSDTRFVRINDIW